MFDFLDPVIDFAADHVVEIGAVAVAGTGLAWYNEWGPFAKDEVVVPQVIPAQPAAQPAVLNPVVTGPTKDQIKKYRKWIAEGNEKKISKKLQKDAIFAKWVATETAKVNLQKAATSMVGQAQLAQQAAKKKQQDAFNAAVQAAVKAELAKLQPAVQP